MLFLLACTGSDDPVDSGRRGRDDDRDDTGTAESGDTGVPNDLPSATDLVAEVRRDHNALLHLSQDYGWPVETAEGHLFVYLASGSWSVAGDFDDWSGAAMNCSEGLCWATVDGPRGGYKFTNGSAWRADPWSRQYTYDDNGEMSLVAEGSSHLERHFGLAGIYMSARTLRVWVPAGGYDRTLFVHDGQNLFDPEAIKGGWHLQDATPPGILLVGIDNTDERFEEYTHTPDRIDGSWYGGEGTEYADYVQGTVRPFVKAHYGEPGVVGTLGSSLGGLISLHIANVYPGAYAFAGSMSGTLGWGSIGTDNPTMIQLYADAGHRDTVVYLDSGGQGDTCRDSDGDGTDDDDPTSSDNYCETIQMRDTLAGLGYEFDKDLFHWWEPGAEHDEAAWAARVDLPLGVFAGL